AHRSSAVTACVASSLSFFVLQAEDGIRDPLVTGVQTCALPISTFRITQCGSDARCIHERRIGVSGAFFVEPEFQDSGYFVYRFRSEERRVGKECRFRPATSTKKKQNMRHYATYSRDSNRDCVGA